jgi:hypothetical protein
MTTANAIRGGAPVYIEATVKGGDKLAAKLMAFIGPAAQDRIKQINEKSAKEFVQLVRVAIPENPHPKGPRLADSITTEPAEPLGVKVSIGGPGATPYPAHLEWGHTMPNGKHVPGRPFWYPAQRVLKKRRWGQIKRAQAAAVRAAVGTGNG